jgi:hypothetical protein
MKSNFDEAQCKAYCDYYAAQSGHAGRQTGGALRVFIGARHQYGAGLGDILRGIFRTVAPILGPVLKSTIGTFLGETGSALSKGQTIKESLRGALKPTAQTAIESTISNVRKAREQSGGGRKRKRKNSGRVYKAKKSRVSNLARRKPKSRKAKSRRAKTRKSPRLKNRILKPPFSNF